MSRRCEFCAGPMEELARTQRHAWIVCGDCHRRWKRPLDDEANDAVEADTRFAEGAASVRASMIRCAAVVLASALAGAACVGLNAALGDASPLLVFTPAVMVATWYGGAASGVAATVLSTFIGRRFLLGTPGGPEIAIRDPIALFVLVGTLMTWVTIVLRARERRLALRLSYEKRFRAEAEAANDAKDEVLALVSHELQTPASVVRGWASTIRTHQLGGPALDQALETIERNAVLQAKVVEDLVDWTRLANGAWRLELEQVALSRVIGAVVEQMRPTIERHRLQFTTTIGDADYPLFADPIRLQQIFMNLLSNAVKFTPDGGHVAIEVSRTAKTVKVVVADDGIGITREVLPRLFHSFQRARRTLNDSRQGLGLGLWLAREFVERHGGTIRASSEGAGKGARFTVELLLEQRQRARSEDRRRDPTARFQIHPETPVDRDACASAMLAPTRTTDAA
jgi:signal transduction histidine kinase